MYFITIITIIISSSYKSCVNQQSRGAVPALDYRADNRSQPPTVGVCCENFHYRQNCPLIFPSLSLTLSLSLSLSLSLTLILSYSLFRSVSLCTCIQNENERKRIRIAYLTESFIIFNFAS